MDYYKYIKYKTKYIELKYDNQYGGGSALCELGYTNVLGTCWMSALLAILCFGDLTGSMIHYEINAYKTESVEEIKKYAGKFIEEKIREIQRDNKIKLPAAFNIFSIFSDNKIGYVKTILHKFIERYYNKVMNIQFGKKPENTNPKTNQDRCERLIGENFHKLFKSYHIKYKGLGASVPHQYLFCNLLSIFFLDYKVSFRNYYNNFSVIDFDDENDLGILIHINGHVCCLYMCNGRQKFYNDNNNTVYDCEWVDLLKKSSATNLLYIEEDECLTIIDNITSYTGYSKIFKVVSLTVISKYITKYTNLDNDITAFLEFSSDIKTIKDPSILTLIGDSYHVIGDSYHDNTQLDKAKEMYKLAADQGYVHGQYSFGAMLYKGDGGKTYDEQARQLFTLAANQGEIDAQYFLGLMLYDGQGGDQDFNKARQMFILAANNDHVKAANMLGLMLYEGKGGDTDLEEARKMFEFAASQGNDKAQFMLGLMLYEGLGGYTDLKEARKMFDFAASQGNDKAKFMLGKMKI